MKTEYPQCGKRRKEKSNGGKDYLLFILVVYYGNAKIGGIHSKE